MKFLVVDDHPAVRSGLAAVLKPFAAEVIVLEAGDQAEALHHVASHPDVQAAFVDLQLPGAHGLRVIAAVLQQQPALAVLAFSASEDPEDVRASLAAGARGYLPKSTPAATIRAALTLVLDGHVYVPPLMLAATGASPPPVAATPSLAALTERQREVLGLICEGRSNKDICQRLGISEKTVKAHVTAVLRCLNVFSRTQAIAAVRAAGLVGTQGP